MGLYKGNTGISYANLGSSSTRIYKGGTLVWPALSYGGSGGNVIIVDGYAVHIFDSPGNYEFTLDTTKTVDLFMIAGGGASGFGEKIIGGTNYFGGGGGAGGAVYRTNFSLTGGTYSITIGRGGYYNGSTNVTAEDTTFGTYTAKGGGSGNNTPPSTGYPDGGCSGGGTWDATSAGVATQPTQSGDSGTYGLGYTGANYPGSPNGGGGGGIGSNASGATGGSGLTLSWTGTSIEYGKGGDGNGNTQQLRKYGYGGSSFDGTTSPGWSYGGDGYLMVRYLIEQ